MQDVEDKVAFVTGGASGIGLGMVRAFLDAGMKVVVADIRQDHLDDAAASLKGDNRAHFLRLDVSDRQGMAAAAEEAERVFGKVHVLCNNAGVGIIGPSKTVTWDDWDWNRKVNLDSVFNGVHVFLPRLLAHGEGGHIVNTASISAVLPGGLVYAAAKAAVLAMSEVWRMELTADEVGVTCLMPGPVNTNIHEVAKLRPANHQDTNLTDFERELAGRQKLDSWLDPYEVGCMVLDAIRRNLAFVFTHNDFKPGVEERFEAILDAFPRGAFDPDHARTLGFPVSRPMYGEMLARGEEPARALPPVRI